MELVLEKRIACGISACNFGARFRYNRAGWDRVEALGREAGEYTWTPVCPEVLAGLGVPRTAVKLSGGSGDDVWQGTARLKNRLGRDVTAAVQQASLASLEALRAAQVDAVVFMEGSPTCGVYRTTLKDRRLGKPPGVFGSLLLKEQLFLIPALDMDSPWKWWDHTRRLHAFVWLKQQSLSAKAEIFAAWHALKFMVQEINRTEADEISRLTAGVPARLTVEWKEAWKMRVLSALRQPSTLKRIESVMFKHYAHYRKEFGLRASELPVPQSEAGKANFIWELSRLERMARERGHLFAGRPVFYRPGRP